MTRREFVLLALAMSRARAARAGGALPVRVGVFGLFRPTRLAVRSGDGAPLALLADRDAAVLRGGEVANLRISDAAVEVSARGRVVVASAVRIAGADGGATRIEVEVPGRIRRTFRGRLDAQTMAGELRPVVTMDLETAVASVVAAEQTTFAAAAALEAQAIAARSYFVAAPHRHRDADCCDTTHCQFLREPPAAASAAARAADETRDLVLAFRRRPFAALYSSSCGGRTQSLAEAGLAAGDGYPYFAVDCPTCARDAKAWDSRLSADPLATRLERDRSEGARLAVARRNGWSAVPGGRFDVHREGGAIVLHGRGAGHGIGLCQAGAAAMARDGASARDILAHYYPGAEVID